jgi:hypothetical protein
MPVITALLVVTGGLKLRPELRKREFVSFVGGHSYEKAFSDGEGIYVRFHQQQKSLK